MTAPISLVGVSIPRAGHHFLAGLLQAALGSELHYCEAYTVKDCCRDLPCSRVAGRRLVFQKNHDFDLALPRDLPGARYLVQYRSPVPQALSDRELYVAQSGAVVGRDRAHYTYWLAGRADYLVRFAAKWLRNRPPDWIVVRYERLRDDPSSVLVDVFERLGIPLVPDRLAEAVRTKKAVNWNPSRRLGTGDRQFRPRDIEASPEFDAALLEEFEDLVLGAAPELGEDRYFRSVPRDGGTMTVIVQARRLARDGEVRDAARRLAEAARAHPPDPYLMLEQGRLETRTSGATSPAALAHLREAHHLAPRDDEIAAALIACHRARGELDLACTVGRSLVEGSPSNSSHRVFLATLLSASRRHGEAMVELREAVRLGFEAPHLWEAARRIAREAEQAGVPAALEPEPEPGRGP